MTTECMSGGGVVEGVGVQWRIREVLTGNANLRLALLRRRNITPVLIPAIRCPLPYGTKETSAHTRVMHGHSFVFFATFQFCVHWQKYDEL